MKRTTERDERKEIENRKHVNIKEPAEGRTGLPKASLLVAGGKRSPPAHPKRKGNHVEGLVRPRSIGSIRVR